jgi:hypothetical protein
MSKLDDLKDELDMLEHRHEDYPWHLDTEEAIEAVKDEIDTIYRNIKILHYDWDEMRIFCVFYMPHKEDI